MEEDARAELRKSDWCHELYVKCVRLLISGLFVALTAGTGYLVYSLLTHSFLAKLNSQAGNVIETLLNEVLEMTVHRKSNRGRAV